MSVSSVIPTVILRPSLPCASSRSMKGVGMNNARKFCTMTSPLRSVSDFHDIVTLVCITEVTVRNLQRTAPWPMYADRLP